MCSSHTRCAVHCIKETPNPQPVPGSDASLVPITLPASGGQRQASRLVGILALGARLSGQGYSREEIAMLLTLADQAGTSLHSLQPAAQPAAAPNA